MAWVRKVGLTWKEVRMGVNGAVTEALELSDRRVDVKLCDYNFSRSLVRSDCIFWTRCTILVQVGSAECLYQSTAYGNGP